MLFSLGHGGRVLSGQSLSGTEAAPVAMGAVAQDPLDKPIEAVIGAGQDQSLPAPDGGDGVLMSPTSGALETMTMQQADAPVLERARRPARGAFRYYFSSAPLADAFGSPQDAEAAFDALATSMVEAPPLFAAAALPPILTYFGQFIDHDITANTDREVSGLSEIGGAVTPATRKDVERGLDNLRDGSLALDSLYGDSVGQTGFPAKLADLMRHPRLRSKMRLGTAEDLDGNRPPLPADPADDLLRLGFLMDQGKITLAELQALPAALKGTFLEDDGTTPIRARAIIGDGRNDENLIVAQLQVAFLRFHNRLADAVERTAHDAFKEARRLTRYHYQWLVTHEYLPGVCDRSVVDEVLREGAPLYRTFFEAEKPDLAAKMPMPLEFSVAAFRFGHSMVRGNYDHNRFFGASEDGSPTLIPTAPFDLLFAFTGNGQMNGGGNGQLPTNWIIEWARFVNAETPLRSARPIDTHLAKPLDELRNEDPGVFKRLAKRNLLRGYRLNLPSAEACISAINATGFYRPITALDPDTVFEGRDAVKAAFSGHTPLWFYVLREAEALGGNHLGPLGSHIVANTLVGLIVKDRTSYWNDSTSGHRWSPSSFRPGAPIDSLKEMLRFSGLLA